MEFMIAWFPALKMGIGLLLSGWLFILFKNGWHKTSYAVLVLIILVAMLNPVGYDGTNSIEATNERVRQVDQNVEQVLIDNPVAIVEPVISFNEKMAIQEKESDARTAKLRHELGLE